MAVLTAPARKPGVSAIIPFGIAIAAIYFGREILIPLALATLLSFLLAPLVTRLERWKLGRIPSVLIVTAIVFGVIFAVGWVVAKQVVSLAENLPSYQEEIVRKVRSVRGQAGGIGASIERLGDELEKAAGEAASQPTSVAAPPIDGVAEAALVQLSTGAAQRDVGETAAATQPAVLGSTSANPLFTVPVAAPMAPIAMLSSYLGLALAPLGTAALVILFVIFMLLEREDLRNRMIRLVSGGNYTVTTTALDDAATRISRYMVALSIVNGTYGLAVGAGLWLIGEWLGQGTPFPSFVLWGLICALLRFVPYVGPFVAGAFPLALAVAVYPGFAVFAATAGLIVVIELISNNIMEPWLYGSRTGMSALAIIVAAAFWTWMWGPIGLLLATPLTVCIVVIGKYVPSLAFLNVLLGDQPALPPDVSFYQRLLAGDRDEATKLAKEHALLKGTEHVPDDLMIPALRMTRHDRTDGDLTAETESSILDAMKLVIHELEQQEAETSAKSAAESAEHEAEQAKESGGQLIVFGCPAHHEAEEHIVRMLSQLMKFSAARVEVLSTRTLPVEIETRIASENPAVVFVSVLPPGGLVQARYLCRRLRKRFKELKIVVGYWGRSRDFDSLLVRFRAAGADFVTTTLVQSGRQIEEMLGSAGAPRVLTDVADVSGAPAGAGG